MNVVYSYRKHCLFVLVPITEYSFGSFVHAKTLFIFPARFANWNVLTRDSRFSTGSGHIFYLPSCFSPSVPLQGSQDLVKSTQLNLRDRLRSPLRFLWLGHTLHSMAKRVDCVEERLLVCRLFQRMLSSRGRDQGGGCCHWFGRIIHS